MNGRLELAPRGFANREYARCALAAFVERRIDERKLSAHGFEQIEAHCARVHADERIDCAVADEIAQRTVEPARVVTRIDGQKPAGAARDARRRVQLVDGELSRGERARPPKSGGAA